MSNKIFSKEDLVNILDRSKRIAMLNGCFDLTHAGHLSLFKHVKEHNIADILIVALNSDQSIRQIKGDKRPIINLTHRSYLISEFQCVDYVTWFDEPSTYELVKCVKPNIIVRGNDTIFKEDELKLYNELNIKIEFVTLLGDLSTTNIINDILNKYC